MNGVHFRIVKDKIFLGIVILLSLLSTFPLLFILFYIVKNGIVSIGWNFLISLPKPTGESGGGIFNAIVGTFMLVVLASVISIPIGVACGIYLSEFRKGCFAALVRFCSGVLTGVPSIVLGIVAYVWIVKPMRGFSALSGGVALAIMMLPVIVQAAEETLKLVPHSIKEAAYALGVPYHRIILKAVLPAGLSGIITGILLAAARVAGETAPLLFTAFGSPFMNTNILKPVNSLPLLIFNYATSPYDDWHSQAWGASLVLVAFVLFLHFVVKLGTKKWKVQF